MPDPIIALAVFAVMVLAAIAALYPRYGLIPRLRKMLHLTERVRLEDALKHCLHEQLEGRLATTSSVAGAIQITRHRAASLLATLDQLAFVVVSDGGTRLTEAGREYATRIMRSHRLWERYLADRTAMRPIDWHAAAEVVEHRLTLDDANALAARMGHPLYDPHGDPIPTERGDLPPAAGSALTEADVGQLLTIVHIEDEPTQSFEQIISSGFRPLMQVKLLEKSPTTIRVSVEGREHELEPMVARNITVVPVATREAPAAKTLAAVRPGHEATVVRISSRCQGPQRRRLLDLGVVPGTVIRAEFESPMHDPVAFRIRGAVIALRKVQAEHVYVTGIRDVDHATLEERHVGVV